MDAILSLKELDIWIVLVGIVLILSAIKFVWGLIDWLFVEKMGIETKAARQRREDSDKLNKVTLLAETTADNLNKLQQRHCDDEKSFRDNLNNYMDESRNDRKIIHDEIKKFQINRINDRKQSLEIQKELKDSITYRDNEIHALLEATKEMLAEKINEKYKYYISINGIPEDEYDEFVSLHDAYNGVGGNHHGDAKFEYCIEHLKIIPTKTKLKYKED